MQPSSRDKFVLYTELAKLVRAGFGLDKAADVLAGEARNAASRRFAEGLREGLARGTTAAAALAGAGATPLEVSVLEAAETGGALEEGLGYLADHFESVRRVRDTITGRLVYPAVLLHLAAFLPVLPALVAGLPARDALRGALVALGVAYGLAFGALAAFRALDRAGRESVGADRFLRRVPLVGGARRAIGLQRFCGVFRMHLRAGSLVSVAVAEAGDATQSAVLRQAARRLAERAGAGESLGEHLREQGAFPPDLVRSLTNAERVGGLEADLARWAAWYGEAVRDRMERVGIWVPKLVYLAVAGYVAWQIIRVYAGIYEPVFQLLEREL